MKSLTKTSKYLSLVLRHQPELIELELNENGWAKVADLLNKVPFDLDFTTLKKIVDTSDKKRFAFSDDFTHIRANQGHSIAVNLALEPKVPPAILYHGTPTKNIPSIQAMGLHKAKRHHVHLSADQQTASIVGNRRGQATILQVSADAMSVAGYLFYQSKNGVWLTDEVPASFIVFPTHAE